MYGILISLVIMVVLLFIERDLFIGGGNPEDRLVFFLILVGASIIGAMSLSFRTFLLPYFTIEIDDKNIIGPSLFGAGWRKVTIPIADVENISHHPVLIILGIYIIQSTKGEKICVSGFDEYQFGKLMKILNAKRQPK